MSAIQSRSRFGFMSALLVAGVLGYTAPVEGVIAGVGILLAWLFLPAPFGFIVAQTGIVALVTPAVTLPFALLELGALGLLLAAGVENEVSTQAWLLGAALGAVCLLVGVGAFGIASMSGRALTIGGLVALVLYGLHRYEKVRLGLVEDLD